MKQTLQFNGITPPPEGRSKTLCPECSHTRKKKTEKCLKVWAEDGLVFWRCFNCGFKGSDVG